MTIVINGTIKTETPLSISMPVSSGGRANGFNNFPVLTRGIDSDGNKLRTGYLPATTLRGFLRRAIVLRDMQVAADQVMPYKLPKAYAELIGQDNASEQKVDEIDLVTLKETRDSSPVIDLFGCGLGIKSRLKVGHFLPTQNVLPDTIVGVRKDLDDNDTAFGLIDQDERASFYRRSKANTQRARAKQILEELKRKRRALERKNECTAEVDAAIKESEKLCEKHQVEMGDMTNSSRAILEHYALPAGLDLSGRLVIESSKERDVELIIQGLDSLSRFPILGAHSARGCGEISGKFNFQKNGDLFKTVSIGGFKEAEIANL